MQALPTLFDGPEDCTLPMVRWGIQYNNKSKYVMEINTMDRVKVVISNIRKS